jgi:hypothetical protein
VTTQTTTFPPGPNYPFAYEELLNYARRISKTTMPPAAILNATRSATRAATQPPASPEGVQTPQTGVEGPSAAGSQQNTSVMPSAAATPSQPLSPAVNGLIPAHFNTQPPSQNANTALPENLAQWLDPLSGQIFHPWPLEEKLRAGSLASNQRLVEKGIDPRGYDPVEEEERERREAEERKEMEEKQRLELEELEKRQREAMEQQRRQREKLQQEQWKSNASSASPDRPTASGGEKKQFQFASLDDDLDDDDD